MIVRCRACNHRYRLAPTHIGKKYRCKHCGGVVDGSTAVQTAAFVTDLLKEMSDGTVLPPAERDDDANDPVTDLEENAEIFREEDSRTGSAAAAADLARKEPVGDPVTVPDAPHAVEPGPQAPSDSEMPISDDTESEAASSAEASTANQDEATEDETKEATESDASSSSSWDSDPLRHIPETHENIRQEDLDETIEHLSDPNNLALPRFTQEHIEWIKVALRERKRLARMQYHDDGVIDEEVTRRLKELDAQIDGVSPVILKVLHYLSRIRAIIPALVVLQEEMKEEDPDPTAQMIKKMKYDCSRAEVQSAVKGLADLHIRPRILDQLARGEIPK